MIRWWWTERAGVPITIAGIVFAVLATPFILEQPALLMAPVGLVAVLLVLTRRRGDLSAYLLLAALPFARPNIFGEKDSLIAFGLAAGAGCLTSAAKRPSAARGARPRRRWERGSLRHLLVTPAFVLLSLLWILIVTDGTASPQPILQSMILTGGFLLAAAFVLADPWRRLIVGRGFVLLTVVACASFTMTAVVWLATGVGDGQISTLNVGDLSAQPVYLPFSPTSGTQLFHGVLFPRFTGFGREPGWMAMYAAFAYVLMRRIGWKSRLMKLVLLVGLLGTISTAGFGVFIVVWTFDRFLSRRVSGPLSPAPVRTIVGLGAVAAAGWVAVFAPGLGLAAKSDLNSTSYNDRLVATTAGWHALLGFDLNGGSAVGGINLMASVAQFGLIYSLLILGALLLPRIGHPAKRLTTAPIGVLVLTLLLSQPPGDSTWVYLMAMLAYGLSIPAGRSRGRAGVGALPARSLARRRADSASH